MNINELDSYNLGDAVKFNDRLNPRIWGADEKMRPEVREQLLNIADDFREFLGIDVEVKDITVSGSNAAYTYTPHSDIDLHLVVDLPMADASEVYRELFDAKKYAYNDQHDIRIGGHEVELYVQDANKQHVSQGIYSITNDDWVSVPKRRRPDVDDISLKSKFEDLGHRIESVVAGGDYEQITALAQRIKELRQAGLDAHGEFGPENLAFKMLRTQGLIKKLYDARNAAKDKLLSLDERKKKRKKKIKYGYGGYWYPGYAYAGQDHPAGSEGGDSGGGDGGGESVREDAGMTWDGVNPTTDMFTSEDAGMTPSGVSPTTAMFTTETEDSSDEEILRDFIEFCVKELKIQHMPRVKLRKDPQWPAVHKTFGRYNDDAKTLEVAWGQRHIMDVLRTVAHELTHKHQHEREGERMGADAGETGSPYENEANAQAGVLMRDYGRLHPEYFAVGQVHDLEEAIDQELSDNDKLYLRILETIKYRSQDFLAARGAGGGHSFTLRILAFLKQLQQLGKENVVKFIQQSIAQANQADRQTKGMSYGVLAQALVQLADQEKEKTFADARREYNKQKQSVQHSVEESASGYIPTRAQAKDPRYSMALTVDIKPGQVGKEANKLKLKTDKQGQPQIARPSGLFETLMAKYKGLDEANIPATTGKFVSPTGSTSSFKAGYDLGVKVVQTPTIAPVSRPDIARTESQKYPQPQEFTAGFKRGTSDVMAYSRNQQQAQQDVTRVSKFAKFKSVTPDQIAQIVQRYSNGEGGPEIAPDFGLNAQQIIRILDKQPNRDEIVKLNRQRRLGRKQPQQTVAEVKARYEMTDLDPWTFDQTPAGWRSLPTSARQADAINQYIDTYVKNGQFVGAPEGAKTLRPYILYWHLGQVLTHMGKHGMAVGVMRQALDDGEPGWNAYVMATISFLRKDRRDFDHWAPLARGNEETIKRLTAGWGLPYKQAYAGQTAVAESKIKLSTDPKWYGAEVGDYTASGPVVNVPADRLVGFEPDDKMDQTASKANVEKIVVALKQGAKLPPLLVRKYKNGYQVLDGHHRLRAYKLLGIKSIPAQVVPDEDIEEIGKQGVAEDAGGYPDVLYHGSTQEIEGPLTPRQANDIGGAKKSNKLAIYATDDPNFAIAYSLAQRGSDTGTLGWNKDPRLIFFGGKIRHGQNVHLHVLPTRDKQGRPLFVRGAADAEWYSRPGVKEITPIKVVSEPVDQYLHLLRKPTPEEQKMFLANKAKNQQAIKEDQQLDEVKMSPSALQQWANSDAAKGIRAGFEAELIFRDTTNDDDDNDEIEPDYDYDERARSVSQVIDFFNGGDYGGLSDRQEGRLQDGLDEQYMEWQDERMRDAFDDEAEDLIRKVLFDEGDWDEDNEIQKQLALLDLTDDEINDIVNAGERAPKFTSSKEQTAYAEANPLYQKYLDAQAEAEGLLDDLVADEVRKKGANWDAALDDFRENFYVDDDSDFFENVGLTYMSDIASEYSLDWPYMTGSGGGNNGGSREWGEIASSLERTVDMPVIVSSNYHSEKRREGQWIVEPDSSLDPDDREDMGLEIVSPPMPLLTALEQLQAVTNWANNPNDGNAYTNSSTGLHMGVSVPYKGGDVDYLKLILFLGDEYVLQSFGREANTYTKSAMSKFRENIRGGRADPAGALMLMKNNLIEFAYREIQKGVGTGKYTSAHIQDGYIEFRSAGGDWLAEESADPQKLSSTMLRYARAMQIAADPSAERKEFAKKLYKFVAPEGDSQLALFSQFAAGAIDKEQLKKQWAEKTIGTELKTNQRWKLYDRATGEPVAGQEYNGYTEEEARARAKGKLSPGSSDRDFDAAYELRNMSTDQQWEVYSVDTGETLEIVTGRNKGEAADAVFDKYANQGIGFNVRAYQDPATMTPRAKLAKRITGQPRKPVDYNYEIVNQADVRLPVVDKFYATNDTDAQKVYSQWLKSKDLPDDTADYGYRKTAAKSAEEPPWVAQNFDSARDSATLQTNLQGRAGQDATEVRRNWEFVNRMSGNVVDTLNNASYNRANAVQADVERRHPNADIYLRSVERPN